MTDYNKWRKFDNDEFVKELEEQQTYSGPCEANLNDKKSTQKSFETTTKLQKNIEIRESKDAVELLKANGRSNRRGRNGQPKIPSAEDSKKVSMLSDIPNVPITDEDRIRKIVELLGQMTMDVGHLQAYTEKKSQHRKGMKVAISSLRKLEELLSLLASLSDKSICDEETRVEIRESTGVLLRQILTCLSLFSLSCGCFGICADVSRVLLSSDIYSKEAGFWIIRAFAFAGMGNTYLCYLHLKTATSFAPSYPGLQSCVSHLEDNNLLSLSPASSATGYTQSVVEAIWKAVYFFSASMHQQEWLTRSPDLSIADVADLRFLLANDVNTDISQPQFGHDNNISVLEWLADTLSPQLQHRLAAEFGQSIECLSPVMMFALHLVHKLWSDAQIFFLEALFYSSEIRYLASLSVLIDVSTTCREFAQSEAVIKLEQGVRAMLSAMLINIGSCRIHRHCMGVMSECDKGEIDIEALLMQRSFGERVDLLKHMSALQLFRLSFQVVANPVSVWKEIELLESVYRFGDALERLTFLVHFVTGVQRLSDSPLCSISNSSIFSQVHLLGKKCHLPRSAVFANNEEVVSDIISAPFWTDDIASPLTSPCKLSALSSAQWQQKAEEKRAHVLYLMDKYAYV